MPGRPLSFLALSLATLLLAIPLSAMRVSPPPDVGKSCPFCDLHGADLSGRDLQDADLVGANLRNANLAKTKLNGAVLIGADLTGAQLDGAALTAADLTNADLTNASLLNATLADAKLLYATLTNTDFTGIDMRQAHFGPSLTYAAGQPPIVMNAEVSCEFQASFRDLDLAKTRAPGCAMAQTAYYCGAFDPGRLTNVIYVSASTGMDSRTCGSSIDAQCSSIVQGLSNCRSAGCAVLVAYDRYALSATIDVRNGIDLYGGCAMMSRPDPAYVTLVTAPPGGQAAFQAANLNDVTTIQGFAVLGTPGTPSNVSIAFRTRNTSALTLSHLTLSAAMGGTGANGGSGREGNRGGDAGTPPAAGTNGSCPGSDGGRGGTDSAQPAGGGPGSTGQSTNPPGSAGLNVSYACPNTRRPTAGTGGTSGGAGTCGAMGTASPNTAGSMTNDTWIPGRGGGGDGGGSGAGGAGGGAGGECRYKSCFGKRWRYIGMEGGGGGAGGCGGTGGAGGTQGGASIALLVVGGTIHVNHSTIIGGRGGVGGSGGGGGPGGRGGISKNNPSSNPCNVRGGTGGTGGAGGSGGAGGGGAGGNGGPAIGIASTSASSIRLDRATRFYIGTGGRGGAGGSSACSSAGNGFTGFAADQKTY